MVLSQDRIFLTTFFRILYSSDKIGNRTAPGSCTTSSIYPEISAKTDSTTIDLLLSAHLAHEKIKMPHYMVL
jgi:hypothetical protein